MVFYNLFALLAAITAMIVLCFEFKKHNIKIIHALLLPLFFLLLSRIGAHLLYCYEKNYWYDSISLYFSLNKGGMSLYGGLYLNIVFAAIYGKVIGISPLKFLDILSPATAFAFSVGRMGCFFAGCCRGFRLPENMVLPDFVPKPHYFPAPLIAVLVNLIIAIILIKSPIQINKYGKRFALFIILYGASRFLIGYLRTNQIIFLGTSMMQILSIPLVVTGFLLILLIDNKTKIKVLYEKLKTYKS